MILSGAREIFWMINFVRLRHRIEIKDENESNTEPLIKEQ